MKLSENFSESEWAALSSEQQAEALRIEKSIRDFLGDRKAIRYIESQGNHDALLDFLSTHELDITHRNLLFAFDSLGDSLELVPFAAPVVEQPPTPIPTQPPAPIPTAQTRQEPTIWRNGKKVQFTNATRL